MAEGGTGVLLAETARVNRRFGQHSYAAGIRKNNKYPICFYLCHVTCSSRVDMGSLVSSFPTTHAMARLQAAASSPTHVRSRVQTGMHKQTVSHRVSLPLPFTFVY
jgi:hypothetical protein